MSIWLPGGRLIQSVAAANDTSITFSSLVSTNDLWYTMVCRLVNDTGTNVNFKLYVNGDTTDRNYYSQGIYAIAGTPGSGRSNVPYVGSLRANDSAIITMWIHCTPGGEFVFYSFPQYEINANILIQSYSGAKTSATIASITSLTFNCDTASSIRTGSIIELYRRL